MPKIVPHPASQNALQHPVNVDRRAGAELVTKLFFPVSHRTIEAWPLPVRRVNGKALYSTADLLAYARQKLEAAPIIRGGKRARI